MNIKTVQRDQARAALTERLYSGVLALWGQLDPARGPVCGGWLPTSRLPPEVKFSCVVRHLDDLILEYFGGFATQFGDEVGRIEVARSGAEAGVIRFMFDGRYLDIEEARIFLASLDSGESVIRDLSRRMAAILIPEPRS